MGALREIRGVGGVPVGDVLSGLIPWLCSHNLPLPLTSLALLAPSWFLRFSLSWSAITTVTSIPFVTQTLLSLWIELYLVPVSVTSPTLIRQDFLSWLMATSY